MDCWAVDFDYESRNEIILRPANFGAEGEILAIADPTQFVEFEAHWTGSYTFESEWQSFRTRRDRGLELTTAPHTYPKAGPYEVSNAYDEVIPGLPVFAAITHQAALPATLDACPFLEDVEVTWCAIPGRSSARAS